MVMDGSTVSIFTVSESSLPDALPIYTEQETSWMPSPETETEYGEEAPVTVAGELSTVQVGAPERPLRTTDRVTDTDAETATAQPLFPSVVWPTEMDGSTVSIFTVSES